MATSYWPQSISQQNQWSSWTQPTPTPTPIPQNPVAIGPVPTPTPPRGVVYTPQYPGGQTFTNQNPISYTQTPEGQKDVRIMQASTGTGDVNQGNLMSKFPGYAGWDPNAAWQDYLATGGSGKGGSTGGGTSGSPGGSTPVTYNIRGTNVNAPSVTEALKQAGLGESDYSAFQQQYPNVEDFLRSIDTEYSAAEQALGSQENALKEAQKLYEETIAKDYAANLSKAQASKASTTGKLEAGKVEAEQKKQDALTAATKLYNELQQGYRQRFGGATSAGEAAQSILGSEQQRQSGLIGRNYMNALSTIESQKADLENSYNSAIADLDAQKQKSIQDVQLSFQNNLQQINSNRAMSVAAREQAKRQILIDNRNQIAQIEANNVAYQRQLEAMKYQQQLALDASIKQMQTQAGLNLAAGQTALNKIPTTVTSNLGQQNQTVSQGVMPTTPAINTAVGSIRYDSAGLPVSSTKNWWEQ